jgi:hypothetical protein
MTGFPSDNIPTLIEIFYQQGHPAFVCGIHGSVTGGTINEIEHDFAENPDLELERLTRGDGRYLFSAEWDSGQFDNTGRCELPPYWDLTLVGFRAFGTDPLTEGEEQEQS